MSPGVLGYPPAASSWSIPLIRYQQQQAAQAAPNGMSTTTAHLYGGYQNNANGNSRAFANGGSASLGTMSSSNGNNSTSSDRTTTRSANSSSQSPAPAHLAHAHEQLSRTNLYIRGLTAEMTDDDLKGMCQQHGKIVSTKAIIDKATNQCKGYGFVDFDCPESAELAVKALQETGIQAQMARVRQEQDPTNLYLANLPPHWTETNLETLLTPYGAVTSTRVLRTANGHSRGVGFARMDSRETCQRIIDKLHGQVVPGLTVEPLLVKFADSGKKKQHYANANFDTMSMSASESYAMSPYDQGLYQSGNLQTLLPQHYQFIRGAYNSGPICYVPAASLGHPYSTAAGATAAYLPYAVPPLLPVNQHIVGFAAPQSGGATGIGSSVGAGDTATTLNAITAQLSQFSFLSAGHAAAAAAAAAQQTMSNGMPLAGMQAIQLAPSSGGYSPAMAAAAVAAQQYQQHHHQPHFIPMPYAQPSIEQTQDRFNNNEVVAQSGAHYTTINEGEQ